MKKIISIIILLASILPLSVVAKEKMCDNTDEKVRYLEAMSSKLREGQIGRFNDDNRIAIRLILGTLKGYKEHYNCDFIDEELSASLRALKLDRCVKEEYDWFKAKINLDTINKGSSYDVSEKLFIFDSCLKNSSKD